MRSKRKRARVCALVSTAVAAAYCAGAAPKPGTSTAGAPTAQVTRIRTLPVVTEASAEQVVQQAVQAAERGEFKVNRSSNRFDRLFDYPLVTLKWLSHYAAASNDDVRSLVASMADNVLRDDDPKVVSLQGMALSMLCAISADPERESSGEALSALAQHLIFNGEGALRTKVDRALLERSLVRVLGDRYDEDAALLLTLLPPDPKLKPLVDSIAKSMNYQGATAIALAHWNDVKDVAAVREKMEGGDVYNIKYFAARSAAIDHPVLLKALWSRLDDRRPTEDDGGAEQKPPRVCDYILAGFKLKFDHKYSGEFPEPASDAALSKAKARYRILIDALPTPNTPPT